ncbi:MAG: 2-oxoacid:acceptor oxidoreductase family protein [Candidatus Lokiarchaeota archaeon]|nr:2-oxoacid:acceptor oxidoreductase family protein [Candidatus Lokiarchaeota archaeon]
MITEIKVSGRGGLGAVTGAEILANAAFLSKNFKDVSSFPTFGTERRGAPVHAFTRLSTDQTIWTRQQIYNPDILVVIDETILTEDLIKSIKPNGTFVLNTDKCAQEIVDLYNISDDITVVVSNVTHECYKYNLIVGGVPMVNTPSIALLAKVVDKLDLKYIEQAIEEQLGKSKAELNLKVAEIAFENADMRKGKSKGGKD